MRARTTVNLMRRRARRRGRLLRCLRIVHDVPLISQSGVNEWRAQFTTFSLSFSLSL